MNHALEQLAREIRLNEPDNERMRLEFGYACAARVTHLLEDPAVAECLRGLAQFLDGSIDRSSLDAIAQRAQSLASHHQGSKSIDGCGHAAVSASYSVAKATAGNALQAADYAAYAAVYGQGGYGAVSSRESFEPEFRWQLSCLASLAGRENLVQ